MLLWKTCPLSPWRPLHAGTGSIHLNTVQPKGGRISPLTKIKDLLLWGSQVSTVAKTKRCKNLAAKKKTKGTRREVKGGQISTLWSRDALKITTEESLQSRHVSLPFYKQQITTQNDLHVHCCCASCLRAIRKKWPHAQHTLVLTRKDGQILSEYTAQRRH